MNNQEVVLLSQLLHSMKKLSQRIEKFFHEKDYENLELAKKEMLVMQSRVEEILKNDK